MKIILYAIPGFIFLILIEWVYGLISNKNTYRLADTITSLSLGSISRLRGILFLSMGSWFYLWVTNDKQLFGLPDHGVAIWLFAIVAYDFSYYWFHRASHEINFFWAAHVVHHQSEDYNLGTALRQSSSGLIRFIFFLPWLYLGIPLKIFISSAAINLIYQFWMHTQHIPKLGYYEKIFVTPSNHRVHHAQNDIYIDKNYGGIFIIWDKLFGSFQPELRQTACVYGLTKSLQSYNPIWANLHVYWKTLQASWRFPLWSDKLKVWLKPPGWQPEGIANRVKPIRPLSDFSKYQPQVSKAIQAYALFQFVLTIVASTALLVQAGNLPRQQLLLIGTLLFFSYYSISTFIEGRPYAFKIELLKLAILFSVKFYLDLSPMLDPLYYVYLLSSLIAVTTLWSGRRDSLRS